MSSKQIQPTTTHHAQPAKAKAPEQEDVSESSSSEEELQQGQVMNDDMDTTSSRQGEAAQSGEEEESNSAEVPKVKSEKKTKDVKQPKDNNKSQDYFTTHLGTLHGTLISKTKLTALLSNEEYAIPQIPDRSNQHTFERDDKESEKERRNKQLKKQQKTQPQDSEKNDQQPEVKKKSVPRAQPDPEKLVFSKSALFTINVWLEQTAIVLNAEMVKNIKSTNPQRQTRKVSDLENVLSTLFDNEDAQILKACAKESVDRLNASYTKVGGERESESSAESD